MKKFQSLVVSVVLLTAGQSETVVAFQTSKLSSTKPLSSSSLGVSSVDRSVDAPASTAVPARPNVSRPRAAIVRPKFSQLVTGSRRPANLMPDVSVPRPNPANDNDNANAGIGMATAGIPSSSKYEYVDQQENIPTTNLAAAVGVVERPLDVQPDNFVAPTPSKPNEPEEYVGQQVVAATTKPVAPISVVDRALDVQPDTFVAPAPSKTNEPEEYVGQQVVATTTKPVAPASVIERSLDVQPDYAVVPTRTASKATGFEDIVKKVESKKLAASTGTKTGGMVCATDLEKRLQHGVAFPSSSTIASTQLAAASAAFDVDFSNMKEEQSQSVAIVQAVSQEEATSNAINALENFDFSKISNVLTPTEGFEALVQKGEFNAACGPTKILFSSALGGCYVGMGAMVSLAVAGNSPDLAAADPGLQKFIFAALFPMNLLLAQQCGGSLYTGNTANMMAAVCEKRATFEDMARVLGLSWIGNLVGCSTFAILCKYSGVLEGGAGVLAAATLVTKTGCALGPLLVKALFCNWLVCLAVLLSTQAKDMGGKYIAIWLPVSTFVSIGFEHSVANMFLLPAGLMSQEDITLSTAVFHNLIPVTIGNAFSGALLVGATMSYLFGSLGKEVDAEEEAIM